MNTVTVSNVAQQPANSEIDDDAVFDESLVRLAQSGLPIVAEPYQHLAFQLGCSEQRVIQRLNIMIDDGRVRRVGVVPNHYRLGYVSNGMSVWDVDDVLIDDVGERVGTLDMVSHCYRRPRKAPDWPYNLFAMVHGKSHEEVIDKVAIIAELLGDHVRGHDVLFSTRILKKTGMRLGDR